MIRGIVGLVFGAVVLALVVQEQRLGRKRAPKSDGDELSQIVHDVIFARSDTACVVYEDHPHVGPRLIWTVAGCCGVQWMFIRNTETLVVEEMRSRDGQRHDAVFVKFPERVSIELATGIVDYFMDRSIPLVQDQLAEGSVTCRSWLASHGG